MVQDIHVTPEPEFIRDADEMDMSEDENDHHMLRYGKRARVDPRECENIRLDTNSINNNKSMPDLNNDVKDQQLKMLQETIRNLQTQLLDNKMKEKENQQKVSDLEMRLKQANVKELLLKTKIVEATKNTTILSSVSALDSETDNCDNDEIVCLDDDENDVSVDVPSLETDTSTVPKIILIDAITPMSTKEKQIMCERLKSDEAHIICLVSTFLVVHPFGTSLDNIHSYVQRMIGNQSLLQTNELKEILRQYTSIFCEENINKGAATECNWKFCGFDRATNVADAKNTTQTSAEQF